MKNSTKNHPPFFNCREGSAGSEDREHKSSNLICTAISRSKSIFQIGYGAKLKTNLRSQVLVLILVQETKRQLFLAQKRGFRASTHSTPFCGADEKFCPLQIG
ncbi:hypothetical protein CIPAW_11G200700 [Carya illinoinensis]|uniref:Uncharacterized protein n=1 Tax=Carya illinoinensis TaxID=32201 RepID=A0A8T1P7Q1_CARIL|nr:hypothetical protein CIPAW_11G200700 [Carya illinoinensis]